jgi:DNA ligase-1
MIFDLRGSDLPYIERLQILKDRIDSINNPNITLVEWTIVHNEEELLQLEETYLDQGYEGVVIRTITGGYKNGRIGKTNPIATRIKRFIEEEAVVIRLIEANENQNEKQTNELGHSFRSSHQENMVGKNSLGTLICKDIKTGQEIKVGPGNLNHKERDFLWNNQEQIIGEVIKYKSFPKGKKDKPRFPTFVELAKGEINFEFVTIRPEFDR